MTERRTLIDLGSADKKQIQLIGLGDKIYRILILSVFGIKSNDFGQAITMKSKLDKVLAHQVRMLVTLPGDSIYDFQGFCLIFT